MTKDEALKKAFKQAFQLGQDYWYQADHEYVSQNKKSDVTRAKFEQLMEDAIKEALAQPEQEYHAVNAVHKGQQCYVKTQPKEPEQEPVGDFYITKDMAEHIKNLEVGWTICASGSKRPTEKKVVPVFVGNTTPPQRTWVGLTEEDKESFWTGDQMSLKEWDELYAAVEAKLKEKNT